MKSTFYLLFYRKKRAQVQAQKKKCLTVTVKALLIKI